MILNIDGLSYYTSESFNPDEYDYVAFWSQKTYLYHINYSSLDDKAYLSLVISSSNNYRNNAHVKYLNYKKLYRIKNDIKLVHQYKEKLKLPFFFKRVVGIDINAEGCPVLKSEYLPITKADVWLYKEGMLLFKEVFDKYIKNKCCQELLDLMFSEKSFISLKGLWNAYTVLDNEDFKFICSAGFMDMVIPILNYSAPVFKKKLKELKEAIGTFDVETISNDETLSKYCAKTYNKETILKLLNKGFTSEQVIHFKKIFGGFSKLSLKRFSFLKKFSGLDNEIILSALEVATKNYSVAQVFIDSEMLEYKMNIRSADEELRNEMGDFVSGRIKKEVLSRGLMPGVFANISREVNNIVLVHDTNKWTQNFADAKKCYKQYFDLSKVQSSIRNFKTNHCRDFELCLNGKSLINDTRSSENVVYCSKKALNNCLIILFNYYDNEGKYAILKRDAVYNIVLGKFEGIKNDSILKKELMPLEKELYSFVTEPFMQKNSLFS